MVADRKSRECEKPRNYDRVATTGGGGGYGAGSGGGGGGGGGAGGDWGTPEPAAAGWGGGKSFTFLTCYIADMSEESTPALVADTSANGKLLRVQGRSSANI